MPPAWARYRSREGPPHFDRELGPRPLAYPVKKKKRGVYVCLKYIGAGNLVSEMERNLGVLDDVMKFQTIQLRDSVDAGTVTVDPRAG